MGKLTNLINFPPKWFCGKFSKNLPEYLLVWQLPITFYHSKVWSLSYTSYFLPHNSSYHSCRFYYEKPGLFTPEQLAEIKKTSLAKVICSNADNISSYPSDVFVHQPVDQFVSCDQLGTPNLFYWKECSGKYSHVFIPTMYCVQFIL